jgi:hypothetical protein
MRCRQTKPGCLACRGPGVRILLAPLSSTVVMSQDIEDTLRRSSGPVRTRRSRGARRLRSSCARSAGAPRAAGAPRRGCGIDRPQPQRWPSADGIPEPGQRLIRDDAAGISRVAAVSRCGMVGHTSCRYHGPASNDSACRGLCGYRVHMNVFSQSQMMPRSRGC